MIEKYSQYLIKDYKYWSVYVHDNQNYLGRCYVWCKRENAMDLPDATEEEQKELFVILQELEKAISDTFKPDILNYAFLGNETHHLHGHLIPRYVKPFQFEGVLFTDKNYGHNYQTDKSFITPPQILEAVMAKLKNHLSY